MTKQFDEIRKKIDEVPVGSDYVNAVNMICLYQMATSLVEIEKELSDIARELKGIKGRV